MKKSVRRRAAARGRDAGAQLSTERKTEVKHAEAVGLLVDSERDSEAPRQQSMNE
jgi:hypothetical protein